MQYCVRIVYGLSNRLGPRAVWERPELERVCQRVGAPEPSFWQVYRYCKRLEATDPTIRVRRTGLSSTPRGLSSLESFLASVKAPRLVAPADQPLCDAPSTGPNRPGI